MVLILGDWILNIRCYRDFYASSESNKRAGNWSLRYLSVFQRKWEPIYGCQKLLIQNKLSIVWRVPRKRMKSKFLDQDVDVVFLLNKGICVRCFVCRNDKLWQSSYGDGKVLYYINITENWFVTSVDRTRKSLDSAFQYITDRLNPLEKGVEFDILFLGPSPSIRFICVQDNTKALVSWKGDSIPIHVLVTENFDRNWTGIAMGNILQPLVLKVWP